MKNSFNKNGYADIIDMMRPKAKNPMPISNRAAQFMPFAALTGYGDAIDESGRITEEKHGLDDERLKSINEGLEKLYENQNRHPFAYIEYFEKDSRKSGGKYRAISAKIKRVEPTEQFLVLEDDKKIYFCDICFVSLEEQK